MRQVILLRIAALIELLFAAGHSAGGLSKWSPVPNNPVLAAMSNVRFDAMGSKRTYLDFYLAFGWSLSVVMVMQAVLLWLLASMMRTNPQQARPMVIVITLANLFCAVITLKFLFLAPALFSLVLVAVVVAACIPSGSSRAAAAAA